jgi:inositol-phosphate phosphatase/L-galactose 1-phosphate phosphatase/histidinol-phosphatase
MTPQEALAFAHELADAARAVALRYWRMPLAADTKADASPVTQADREIEATLRRLIAARHPQHGILGEEEAHTNPQAPWQWVIDPIDGTRAFMAGIPTFTTLISLCEHGRPVMGLIDQPVLRERWAACDGMPAASSKNTGKQLANALLVTTSTPYFSPTERQAYDTLSHACGHSLLGGDAYLYAMLAEGRVDVVLDAGLKPYDFCALAPVIAQSGGIITDWQGKPLSLQSSGQVLAAASPALHAEALALLARLAK